MNTKFISLMILFFNFVSASDNSLTRNAFWDLQIADNDSVTTDQSMKIDNSTQKKNPLLNGLFSLAIPGAGQFNTERYTKSIIFVAVEVGLITFAIINNKNGDKKTKEFQRYADDHWSPVRYAQWINAHGVSDYGPVVAFTQTDFDAIANYDFTRIREWEQGTHNPNGFSHQLPSHGEQQYYELIGKYVGYKFGWDTYEQDAQGIPVSDNGSYYSKVPQQMLDYSAMRGKANDYYYAAEFAVSALVINHVVSAIDAFLSTRAYNKEISATVGMKPVDTIEGKRLMSELKISVGF